MSENKNVALSNSKIVENEKNELLKIIKIDINELIKNSEYKKSILLENDDNTISKVNLIYPINGKVLNKVEYEKLFCRNKENKKRSYEKLNEKINSDETKNRGSSSNLNSNTSNKENPNLINNNKKLKLPQTSKHNIKINNNHLQIIDPQRKVYQTWKSSKLEDEINKHKKSIKEMEDEDLKKYKIMQDIEIFTLSYKKWLKISQDAVYSILEMFPLNQNYEKNTIKSLIEHYKIDEELIKYDNENECFKEE